MSYLKKALLPGEAIDQRPKFSNMAQFGAPSVEFVIIVLVWWVAREAALEFAKPALPDAAWFDDVLHWTYVIGLGLFAFRFVCRMAYRALRLQFRELGVTNHRFMEKDGVFNLRFWSTDLEKIVRVSIDQPLLGRVFNYGSLTIVTVGEVEHTTAGIAGPIALQTALHARMAARQDGGGGFAEPDVRAQDAAGDPLKSPVSRPADV